MARFTINANGYNELVKRLAPERRKAIASAALLQGATFVRNVIRNNYRSLKPDSELWRGYVLYLFPSGTGAVVRRFYAKKRTGSGTLDRAYILNFIEKGATNRTTRGRGRYKSGLNRGSLPAYHVFSRGSRQAKEGALGLIRRKLLTEIAKMSK